MITVCRVHPPPHVYGIRERKERKTRVPSPRAEAPCHAQQVRCKPRTCNRAKGERQRES